MSSSNFHGQATSKSRKRVKPILRKLTQSEHNSLDLDRPVLDEDGLRAYDFGGTNRPTHDIVHQTGRRGFHARSASGTSQYSNGSSQRAGSFVHPFIQTPRPYTPPFGTPSQHSSSPAHTEDEEGHQRHTFRINSNFSNKTPSLNSAISPTTTQPPLRVQTKQQHSSLSRLALATSNTSLNTSGYLSPLSPDIASPTDTMTPVSAIRSSMDTGFRIRSHSNDGHTRQRSNTETIAEARRKFDEREAAKEEKAAREEIRKRERDSQKEAKRIERGHRRSSASDATRNQRSRSDLTMQSHSEKSGSFITPDYSPMHHPDLEIFEEHPSRSHTTTSAVKMKTHSTWTKFMMWLRTRFLRMGKKKNKGQS